jgi:S-adenosylmethionine:diacylglycerol 3-amino-3-carboxypropyl transferase
MRTSGAEIAWQQGRLDGREGRSTLLFGRMHEDSTIELAVFRPGGRIFCIASAGCTAIALSQRHEVVAADVNPVQIAYARRRLAGERGYPGAAERMIAVGRACAPFVGWRPSRVREFLDLHDPEEQIVFWHRHLDTWRFRAALDAVLSRIALGTAYAKPLLRDLPRRFGRVMRARMARGFARHPNRENPYARALFLGEFPDPPRLPEAERIRLVHCEAAAYLEQQPPASFNGFSLSNILDGASDTHRRRLRDAVRRAATPDAIAVIRSFAEPAAAQGANLAAQDRAMLWGLVEAVPAAAL